MREQRRSQSSIAIYFAILLSGLFLVTSLFHPFSSNSSADQTTAPLIWIELSNETITIEGDFGSDMVQVNGTIHYRFPPGYLDNNRCYVDLESEIELEKLKVEVFPNPVRIDSGVSGTTPFYIRLYKYHDDYLISASRNYEFRIGGEWSMKNSSDNGSIDTVSLDIVISPYCWFDSLYPEEEDKISGKIGTWKTIPITLINRGNSILNITLEAETEDDIRYELTETEVSIPEGEEYILNLSVKQSDGFGRTNRILLKVQGESGESSDWESINVPFKTHNTVGSLLISFWWVVLIIVMLPLLIIGFTILFIKVKKEK